ncbi:MAG: DUF1467 family protein [Paracoccaceae bacterium]
MTITAALVLFASIWFLVLFVALPLGERSQEEAGDVVPGTPASAPDDPMLKKKVIWTTVITVAIWALLSAFIMSGWLTVRDIDFFDRMSPPSGQEE